LYENKYKEGKTLAPIFEFLYFSKKNFEKPNKEYNNSKGKMFNCYEKLKNSRLN
jgi:hypothetical protein